ncbi:hypothetical protein I4U23_012082 [Adineta vaga]|nr:hypothetical protein I4U23_012082 [Adineta vaga]
MEFRTGILIIALLISNCDVQAYRYQKTKGDYSQIKRLQHLLRRLELSSDHQLFFNRRAEAEGDCTADILEGYQWNGDEALSIPGIDSTQSCMDRCDIDAKCMGWSYKPDSKMCWGLTNIKGVVAVSGVRSGSCVGTNLKTKCVENKSGQYPGNTIDTLTDIATVENCMGKCDGVNTCFGWLYGTYDKKCYLFNSLGTYMESEGFLTGSCLAPQKRIRLGEPVKIVRKEVLARHNEKRKMHCVSDLTLDNDLNKVSQDLADKLAAADITPPDYDASKMQSVYYGKGDAALHGSVVVDNFYNEHKYYKYDSPDFSFTKYFPKIIWKSTTKLGVGRAFTNDKKSMFIVISYDSRDSLGEGYKNNVQKPCA